MNTMFDGSDHSDCERNFKTNNEYAKKYNSWRQKELLNGLKTKYGDISSNDDDSSSSEEDDDEADLPQQVELDFLKTLSSLKNKDPKIYDEKVKFFDDEPIDPTVPKKKKDQTMFIKDYERKMLLEHNGKVDEYEEEDMAHTSRSVSYVEEQANIKKSLKSQLEKIDDDDDDDSNYGGLFQTRVKSKDEQENEELEYKQWLKGRKDTLTNTEDEMTLQPLKDFWNDPKLDDGEKFLRDYILNSRFKEGTDPTYVPTYEEIVHDDEALSEDESNVDKQEEFEHKFNYRFEEPDQEFLKRYPRTVENSLRKTDDRRKMKRQEVKERKAREKEEKMEELKQLKEIKRQEIEEKIKKLKEITGNTDVAFVNQDIDDDFDPDAHDKRMHILFNDEFYDGEEGDEKPEFPDIDDELEIERWDKYPKEQINNTDDEPHAEDEDFNMDCDYDPSTSTQNELTENSKGKKKRKKRKSKFAKAVCEPKPVFDPNDKSYEEYLDEYYKLDCEDIVGGVPCRFKYRKVAANNFGLTIEEILQANDKELNRWCSIKKAMQYRPDHVEKYDQIAYGRKGQNESLKQKILPSLFETLEHEDGGDAARCREMLSELPTSNMTKVDAARAENGDEECCKSKKRKRPRKKACDIKSETFKEAVNTNYTRQKSKKKRKSERKTTNSTGTIENTNDNQKGDKNQEKTKKKNKNKGNKDSKLGTKQECVFSDARLQAFGIKPKKFKNKLKYGTKHAQTGKGD